MRFIKFSIAGLVVLFALFTLIGLLMPSSVTVGRSVEINAPADSVRFYTNDFANWRYWISGADTAYYEPLTASTSSKNSKIKLGTYTVTVIDINLNYIVTVWQGESTREQLNRLNLYYNASSGTTTLNWSFKQQLHWYPWERLSAMLHDKVFGPSMEASLGRLKQVCEK
jgi:hypothetical protein